MFLRRNGFTPLLGSLVAAPLLEPRSVFDAARIASDPARTSDNAPWRAVPQAVSLQLYANLRSRLHEPLARLVRTPFLNYESRKLHQRSMDDFARRQGLEHIDLWFRTHPLVETLLMAWKLGNPAMGLNRLADNRHHITPQTVPTLRSVLAAIERSGIGIPEVINRTLQAHPVRLEGGRRFDPQFFFGLNSRGIEGYERHLFGFDPLSSHGFHLQPTELPFDRFLESIPRGGVVADWGAGAGIFATELKETRPDLTLYTVDQFSPQEVLSHILPGPAGDGVRDDIEKYLNVLVGDALEITLPRSVRADAIISVALSPYVRDPLRLVAHLYNQLKPGGLLVMTLTQFMHDASKRYDQEQNVVLDVTAELFEQGVRYSFARGQKTLILQRADERELKITAECVASLYEPFELNLGTRIAELEHCLSFYRPANLSAKRWIALI